VPTLDFYRYFVTCRPDPTTRTVLAALGRAAGQRLCPDYHVTFCVIAESLERDPSIREQVGFALAGGLLYSAPIPFGRVVSGPRGAMIKTIGRHDELQDLYAEVVRRLGSVGIEAKCREAGFHPHSMLGYDSCNFKPFIIARHWVPEELLLIESAVGLTQHRVLGRWSLLPPRQLLLPFGAHSDPPPSGRAIAATSHARRSAA
jgi:hypothetical protein